MALKRGANESVLHYALKPKRVVMNKICDRLPYSGNSVASLGRQFNVNESIIQINKSYKIQFTTEVTPLLSRFCSTDKFREKSINQVLLLGRVGVDPQMRGSEERPVTVFTLATNTRFKDNSGEMQQRTEWHRISVFKPYLRDTIFNYLKKGQRCLIQGKLAYGKITDANGSVHTTSTVVADEIVFFPRKTDAKDEDEAEAELL